MPDKIEDLSKPYRVAKGKHFAIKGAEVANACAHTLYSLEHLRGQVAAGIV